MLTSIQVNRENNILYKHQRVKLVLKSCNCVFPRTEFRSLRGRRGVFTHSRHTDAQSEAWTVDLCVWGGSGWSKQLSNDSWSSPEQKNHEKNFRDKKKQKKKHGMKTTESRCSEHFSLFLALGLTSALCVLECHFSLQLTEQQQYKQQWSTDWV